MCTNLTSKPESSIGKCTFCKGHHKATTCKLRKKIMTGSGHANVQYVKDTMAFEEDENDPMHPDLVVANWLQDKDLTQQYVECMEKDNLYKDIYKRARDGEKILTIQYKDKFLCILKRATWKLVIPTGHKIRSKSAQEHLLQLAHAYTGHGGLDKTYQELTSKYYSHNSYSDTQDYVRSCGNCQSTKGSTQLPIEYLTLLNVPTQPWKSIAMDFLSMEPVTIPCSELIPGYYKLKGEGSHNISFDKLLIISCRHNDFTFLIPCIKELNAKDVVDIFETWIKPTVGLPYEIITDQDVLFISALFQDWANSVGVRHKASSACHPQTDGASERKNKTIIPMFAGKELEDGTNWVQAAPSVQIEVNTAVSGPRGKSP